MSYFVVTTIQLEAWDDFWQHFQHWSTNIHRNQRFFRTPCSWIMIYIKSINISSYIFTILCLGIGNCHLELGSSLHQTPAHVRLRTANHIPTPTTSHPKMQNVIPTHSNKEKVATLHDILTFCVVPRCAMPRWTIGPSPLWAKVSKRSPCQIGSPGERCAIAGPWNHGTAWVLSTCFSWTSTNGSIFGCHLVRKHPIKQEPDVTSRLVK